MIHDMCLELGDHTHAAILKIANEIVGYNLLMKFGSPNFKTCNTHARASCSNEGALRGHPQRVREIGISHHSCVRAHCTFPAIDESPSAAFVQ
jgi:hypothetical protein